MFNLLFLFILEKFRNRIHQKHQQQEIFSYLSIYANQSKQKAYLNRLLKLRQANIFYSKRSLIDQIAAPFYQKTMLKSYLLTLQSHVANKEFQRMQKNKMDRICNKIQLTRHWKNWKEFLQEK